MAGESESVNWRRLNEFNGVDLLRSFVLSWQIDGDALHIELDLHLTPEHAFYETPRPAEKYCIRPAILEFPHCDSLDAGDGARAPGDVAAALGHGAIADLNRRDEGPYEISGDFGTVIIDAERPILRLTRN